MPGRIILFSVKSVGASGFSLESIRTNSPGTKSIKKGMEASNVKGTKS